MVSEFHQLVQNLRLDVAVLSEERIEELIRLVISQTRTGGKYDVTSQYGHNCIDDFYELRFKKHIKLKKIYPWSLLFY